MKKKNTSIPGLSTSCKANSSLIALVALILISFSSSSIAADYEGMLISQTAKMSLCGELNYKRRERNCADPNVSDVKRCLDLNRRDPLFIYQEEKQYSCVNSGYSHGVGIIAEVLESSEKGGGCLAKNVFQLYDEVLANTQFQALSRQWEESLEVPLSLDVGIDTKDNIFNLQINLASLDLPANQQQAVPLSVSSFNEKGPCLQLSTKEVLGKLGLELTRLNLVKSKKEVDYLGQDPDTTHDANVFDADRFGQRSPSSDDSIKEVDYSSANR